MKTKKQITIGYAGQLFPAIEFKIGTTCRLAHNMPLTEDTNEKRYWLSLPRGFNGGKFHKEIKSFGRNCGFLVNYSDIF